ncbi:hypothetical protein DUNSADRAFT_16244 [Dunaliella salina]|uniref:Transmembrane protein n=1 Tax=Dunaliella salina TaxID=3046 RepID=A0ABQ7H148_DUNSA|nr:hypothetical protein DUNSADRAFT_16244 [Dunaliella salina]|eukprot:KAF5840581.1 hypothetical protein DUNSADRAFT_16244 [Dunaliella salina]
MNCHALIFHMDAALVITLLSHALVSSFSCCSSSSRSCLTLLCLQDAADRGRMGATTFKNLNLGLSGLAFFSGFSLWASGLLISNLVLTVPAGVGLVCLYFSLSAQK